VLKKSKFKCLIITFIGVLLLTSCRNPNLSWRSGHLVAQLYRQSNQEVLLAYNDFEQDMVIDKTKGLKRAYFDNYRKQLILIPQVGLEYTIGDKQIKTATEEITGYVSTVLMNENHQIGVEIMSYKPNEEGAETFNGLRSRVIDLQTQRYVIVDGLLFNRGELVGDYFYGFAVSDGAQEQLLDIINVTTMEHTRINTEANEISFLYRAGDKVYAQSDKSMTAFLFEGNEMIEQSDAYIEGMLSPGGGREILKDIAPIGSEEHWYVEAVNPLGRISEARLVRFIKNEVTERVLSLDRDNVVQIMDVANYGEDKLALFLTIKDDDESLHAVISVFNLQGNKLQDTEITHIRGDYGQFTYLDYVL